MEASQTTTGTFLDLHGSQIWSLATLALFSVWTFYLMPNVVFISNRLDDRRHQLFLSVWQVVVLLLLCVFIWMTTLDLMNIFCTIYQHHDKRIPTGFVIPVDKDALPIVKLLLIPSKQRFAVLITLSLLLCYLLRKLVDVEMYTFHFRLPLRYYVSEIGSSSYYLQRPLPESFHNNEEVVHLPRFRSQTLVPEVKRRRRRRRYSVSV